ncbi:MAG: type II toxin-antitoxin system RelE/ParE family toxin [bacterium]|nr:type II toxin-antitoxin system RelE/ParE family toxin [bacterium]
MVVLYSKRFRKNYKKLRLALRQKFKDRRNLFLTDPFNPLLDNHPLHGKYDGCRSINITGDYRAIYYYETENTVRFIAIGTHPELYGT